MKKFVLSILFFAITFCVAQAQHLPDEFYSRLEYLHDSLHISAFDPPYDYVVDADTIAVPVKGEEIFKDTIPVEMVLNPDTLPQLAFVPNVISEVVADRLGCMQQQIELTANDHSVRFIDFFSRRRRDYTQKMLTRMPFYFPIFEQALKRHNMPDEIKYLSIVESGLDPEAISRAGAAGLWQFMPYTGKIFGLEQNYYIDERMDPYKATDAACRYLKQLHRMFNDWQMALAAYNCGPGNVRKAKRYSGGQNTFWGVYRWLPRETRSYVPQFIAAAYSVNYANDHFIYADSLLQPFEWDTITIRNRYVNLNTFCDVTGINLDTLHLLNPELRRNVIPPYIDAYNLRIPAYNKKNLSENNILLAALDSAKQYHPLDRLKGNRYQAASVGTGNKIYHRVRSGEVLGSIATKYHVSVTQIQRWNGLQNSRIYAGQRLRIYSRRPLYQTSNAQAQTKTQSPPRKGEYHFYTVQRGDTLWTISKKYDGVTIQDIKTANKLSGNGIKPGQRLKIAL